MVNTASATTVYTPMITPTTQPDAVVNVLALNVRGGPGVVYDRVGIVLKADELEVVGQAYDCNWLQVITPDGDEGWVSSSYVILNVTCDTVASTSTPTSLALIVTPTSVPIFVALDTPTDTPAPILVALDTPTGTPTPGAPPPPPTPRPTLESSISQLRENFVVLLRPLETELGGRQEFEWWANFALGPNQAFDLVFWEPNGDPMRDEFSLVAATKASVVSIDLENALAFMLQLRTERHYKWGVLLVELTPYRRIQFLRGEHTFRLVYSREIATLVPADTPTNTPEPTVTLRPTTPTPR